jgi:C4-dicarboxylate-specific signal transduction histidine kinase
MRESFHGVYPHLIANDPCAPFGDQAGARIAAHGAPRESPEEEVAEARSKLAHMARIMCLGALTASIAHEVSQPLSGILTNASTCLRMLAADPPDINGARETARRTVRDGERVSDVITRLRLLFSKGEAAMDLVDLNVAARDAVALSLAELERGRVVLRLELSADLPPVAGDGVQLQQVILNLLLNAADAMIDVEGRPRELLIRTAVDGDGRVRLSVQDAGAGFGPAGMDRIFEPFYTTKSKGMGIGLAVSRTIVERHHGRLWADPNEGPGVTFSFAVPIISGDALTGADRSHAVDAVRTAVPARPESIA